MLYFLKIFFFFLDCNVVSNSDLVELPKYLSCSLSKTCTTVDCCMDFDLLNLTLNFHISVDTCGYIIRFGIEKLKFELPFSNYVWGKYICIRTLLRFLAVILIRFT